MKHSPSIIFALLIPMLLSACYFSPWKEITYENMELKNVEPYSDSRMPSIDLKSKYFINAAFVEIYTKGKDDFLYNVKGPYSFFISIHAQTGHHLYALIDNITFSSSLGTKYKSFENTKFPIRIDFLESGYEYQTKFYSTDPVFDFNYKKKEKITVTTEITVFSTDGQEKKSICCELIPVIKSGLFKMSD